MLEKFNCFEIFDIMLTNLYFKSQVFYWLHFYFGIVVLLIDANIQLHAIEWMKEFLMLAGRQMLAFYPGIVNCVLSTQAYIGDHRRACKECAKQVDEVLRQLITTEDDSQR